MLYRFRAPPGGVRIHFCIFRNGLGAYHPTCRGSVCRADVFFQAQTGRTGSKNQPSSCRRRFYYGRGTQRRRRRGKETGRRIKALPRLKTPHIYNMVYRENSVRIVRTVFLFPFLLPTDTPATNGDGDPAEHIFLRFVLNHSLRLNIVAPPLRGNFFNLRVIGRRMQYQIVAEIQRDVPDSFHSRIVFARIIGKEYQIAPL